MVNERATGDGMEEENEQVTWCSDVGIDGRGRARAQCDLIHSFAHHLAPTHSTPSAALDVRTRSRAPVTSQSLNKEASSLLNCLAVTGNTVVGGSAGEGSAEELRRYGSGKRRSRHWSWNQTNPLRFQTPCSSHCVPPLPVQQNPCGWVRRQWTATDGL